MIVNIIILVINMIVGITAVVFIMMNVNILILISNMIVGITDCGCGFFIMMIVHYKIILLISSTMRSPYAFYPGVALR